MLPYCLVNSIGPINNYRGVVEEIQKAGKIEETGGKHGKQAEISQITYIICD